jgi:Ser/Thr protein kinase RdoA (MazF antagonist)
MTKAHEAHGLDGTMVAPDWSPLTPDEVCRVLAQYLELEGPFEIVSVSPRPLSAASVVATRNERVFVKRHALAVRDAVGLEEEHRFMAHLRDDGIAVPRVYADVSGGTAIESGEWTYEVHSVPQGIDAYVDVISWMPFRSAEHARSAGEMLARMHMAAEDYDAPRREGRHLVAGFSIFAAADPDAELRRYVAERPALLAYLERGGCAREALDLLAPFHAELWPLLPALQPLWTHNDLHGSNLFWSDAGPGARATAVIDFGLCDRTNAVHDLAHAIERSVVEWLALVNAPDEPERVPVHLDHLWAMLRGYEYVRPLPREDRAALAPMLALCHAEFALSETDYFLSILHAPEKALLACEGYFLGHARWWAGAGAAVLDEIRRWADGAVRE